MTVLLEAVGVRVEREAGVLLDIPRVAVEGSEIVVIVGPTDAGKTLLAAVLSGRGGATAGSVHVAGRRLEGPPSARIRAGLSATVADGGRIAGITVREALRLAGPLRAAEALARLPLLAARAEVRAEALSGGEQQALQVACAWCASPRVLVLDAPTTGLAAETAEAIRRLAADSAATGAAVLWLDQDAGGTPVPPRWLLRAGALTPAEAAASGPALS